MGKLYDSLLSGTSGRTGRIVVANVYGNEYTRIRPRKRTTAATSKQLLIQQRMKDTVAFMQSYRNYACQYFGQRVGVKSRYNLAMVNILDSMTIDYVAESISIIYSNVAFSRGGLLAPIPLTLTKPDPASLEITWQNNAGANPTRESDLIQILIAAEGEPLTHFIENAAMRSATTYSVTIPVQMQGKPLHIYLAFKSTDETLASNSHYAGTIT